MILAQNMYTQYDVIQFPLPPLVQESKGYAHVTQ